MKKREQGTQKIEQENDWKWHLKFLQRSLTIRLTQVGRSRDTSKGCRTERLYHSMTPKIEAKETCAGVSTWLAIKVWYHELSILNFLTMP